MTRPAHALGDTATRALLAVMTQQRPTVRSVAREVGKSTTATYQQLRKLRAAGLVEWHEGKQSTLRAVVLPARTGVRYDEATIETAPSSVGSADTGPGPTHLVGGGRLEADSIPPALVLHEGGHA